jgi:HMG (high mobility group) box
MKFCIETRIHLKKKYPTATISTISLMLSVMWKKMPRTMKNKFMNSFDLKKDDWCNIVAKPVGNNMSLDALHLDAQSQRH